MSLTCTCDKWDRNIKIINSAMVLSSVHGGSNQVDTANYCMYCGKKLFSDAEALTSEGGQDD